MRNLKKTTLKTRGIRKFSRICWISGLLFQLSAIIKIFRLETKKNIKKNKHLLGISFGSQVVVKLTNRISELLKDFS